MCSRRYLEATPPSPSLLSIRNCTYNHAYICLYIVLLIKPVAIVLANERSQLPLMPSHLRSVGDVGAAARRAGGRTRARWGCVRRRWSRGRHGCRGRCSRHALEYNRANHLASTSLMGTCRRRPLFKLIRTYGSRLAALGAVARRRERESNLLTIMEVVMYSSQQMACSCIFCKSVESIMRLDA